MTARLGTRPDGSPLDLDVEALIGAHLCVAANSGGGKSGAIRKLLETTHGRVQHIILDAEDEFYTLRERYDYVIAGGEGGDTRATVANARGLAAAALAHGFSLIAQINDLGEDAAEFIAEFLGGLMSAPREQWRPILVVIDEAQRFAPAKGSSPASGALKSLLHRGRKRGFTGVLATTRLSELDAGVRGLARNWLLGFVGQTLDRRTAAEQLGFAPSSAEARGLQHLEPRQFWGFGPAIARQPALFTVDQVETTIVKSGQAKVPTPPAPEALREILAGLLTAPSSAGVVHPETAEFRANPALLGQIAELSEKLVQAERDCAFWAERAAVRASIIDRVRAALQEQGDKIPAQGGGCPEVDEGQTEGPPVTADPRAQPVRQRQEPRSGPVPSSQPSSGGGAGSNLPPRRKRILDAIAWGCEHFRRESVDRSVAAWLADASPRSSSYSNDLGALRTAGLVDYPSSGMLALTAAGLELAAPPTTPTSREARWAAIAAKLPPRQVKIVDALLEERPLRRVALAAAAGASATSSSFSNDLGRLWSLELIDYPASGIVDLGRILTNG